MSVEITQTGSNMNLSITQTGQVANVEITVARGPQGQDGAAGPAGPAGPNTITSATTSDGTGNISLNTLEVLGTLTASHIHGNLAGSVYAHVRAGENLAKGDPVYVSGSHGSGSTLIAIVSKADAANAAKMPAVGVMDAAVTANANGHMVITGTISDVNTAAYAINAELYVANGGGLTATPPAASSQPVGRVERSNTNNGAFIVKVNGWASSGGNGVSDANKLVRFGSSGTIPISSVTGSRSGIDSRTSFPNDDVTAATSLAVNGTIVKRDGSGSIIITNLTVTGGTAYQSTASFVYLGTSAATHRTALGLTALATTTPGSGVATFLATPTSDNLAAALTDETGTSGGFVRAGSPTITSPTIAGSAQFTGTDRPTSAATGSPAATDLITRADGDARYANFLYYKVSSALSANSTAKVFDTTTLTIPVGTYEVHVHGRAIYNGSNGGWSFGVERANGNSGTASSLIFGHICESGIFNNVSGAARAPTLNFSGNPILAASGSATSLNRTGQASSSGLLIVTSELVVVWYVAQVATDAANPTTLNENSFLLLKKIA